MKIHLIPTHGGRFAAKLPHQNCGFVLVPGATCECGNHIDGAAQVRGDQPTTNYDTYTSIARCVGCGVVLGTLEVKVDTVFGIEEDLRVCGSGIKVY